MNEVINKYLPIIQIHYPDTQPKDIQFFNDGHDHFIFLLQNGTTFRFPRGIEYAKKDTVENIFLPDFAKKSPIPIQVFTVHTDKQSKIIYQTYQFIYGKHLSVDFAKTFLIKERLEIAKKLGKFLKVLHSYPIEKARTMKMDELIVKEYYEFFEKIWPENRKIIYLLLSKDEQQWCDGIFKSYMETRDQSFAPVVTHNDMLPEHIIVHEKKHTLSGMIDFSLRIADPARDFMFLHCYGDDFLETVFAEHGPIDKTFKKRRKFYGGNFYVMYLYNAVTAKEKDAGTIEKHKQALSRYISENPLS